MYEELVIALRKRAVELPEKFSKNAENIDLFLKATAAIEELSRLHEAQRQNLITLMNEDPEMEWIPVTERLPDEYVSVLCYCSRNGQYGCGERCKEDNGTIYWIGLNGMIPTHWMPLPEPPKEDEA